MDVLDFHKGNNGKFYQSMLEFAQLKFPNGDEYADALLSKFVGIPLPCVFIGIKLFHKTLIANELGNYLLTGVKNEHIHHAVIMAHTEMVIHKSITYRLLG